ncbi:purine-binding chemotaxis protein CheW [Agrobacterium vitis]|nr:purine-binding chemotaxis protein CheW [Agrobacterium vitis]MBE1439916.1 purine-binding chemotaxis protein CheW [Agrobacterium vitis]
MLDAIKNSGPERGGFLAFQYGDQDFGVNTMSDRNTRGWKPVTSLPRSADGIMGVFNLHGGVLPIANQMSGLPVMWLEHDAGCRDIVAQASSGVAGLRVDAISDVACVTNDIIHRTPEVRSGLMRQDARGIMALDKRMVCLTELACLFSQPEGEAA